MDIKITVTGAGPTILGNLENSGDCPFSKEKRLLIPSTGQPSHQIRANGLGGLLELYQGIYDWLERPYVLSAILQFEKFHGNSIADARENYRILDVKASMVWCYMIAVVCHSTQIGELSSSMRSYLNASQKGLLNYADGLLLKRQVKSVSEAMEAAVKKTVAVRTDGSAVLSCKGDIYTVTRVKDQISFSEKQA